MAFQVLVETTNIGGKPLSSLVAPIQGTACTRGSCGAGEVPVEGQLQLWLRAPALPLTRSVTLVRTCAFLGLLGPIYLKGRGLCSLYDSAILQNGQKPMNCFSHFSDLHWGHKSGSPSLGNKKKADFT